MRHWRAGLFALFTIAGVAMASWVTRTPAIRDEIGASPAGPPAAWSPGWAAGRSPPPA